MELNKCTRCGCFYNSISNVCPTCMQKDSSEIDVLKNFLNENEATSINDLSYQTGITINNLNRFFKLDEFKNIKF